MSHVKNLIKNFPDFHLNIPKWEIPDEGITMLWGPSGAGKTTVIRTLIGLEACPELEWRFGSQNIAKLEPFERQISVVFQNLSLFPHLTARENIVFPVEAQNKPANEYEADLQQICSLLQLEPLLQRKTLQLSGGEKQRVALARALITRPRLIMLDEPFSSLDIQLKKQARELLKTIQKERKTPMLLVSHDPIDAEQLAQQVVILEKGTIKTTQTPQDFLKSL